MNLLYLSNTTLTLKFYTFTIKPKGVKMKKTILALATLGVLAFGADYSAMSTTDLAALRGTVPSTDKTAFQTAMQSKMATATTEERAAMKQSKSGSADGTGLKKGGGRK